MGSKDVIIIDLDGTLLTQGTRPRPSVVAFCHSRQTDYDIIVVTSRTYTSRWKTENTLAQLRIKPALIVYGIGEDSPVIKGRVVSRIMKKANVVLALDNHPGVLIEYGELGIKAMHPDELTDSGGIW